MAFPRGVASGWKPSAAKPIRRSRDGVGPGRNGPRAPPRYHAALPAARRTTRADPAGSSETEASPWLRPMMLPSSRIGSPSSRPGPPAGREWRRVGHPPADRAAVSGQPGGSRISRARCRSGTAPRGLQPAARYSAILADRRDRGRVGVSGVGHVVPKLGRRAVDRTGAYPAARRPATRPTQRGSCSARRMRGPSTRGVTRGWVWIASSSAGAKPPSGPISRRGSVVATIGGATIRSVRDKQATAVGQSCKTPTACAARGLPARSDAHSARRLRWQLHEIARDLPAGHSSAWLAPSTAPTRQFGGLLDDEIGCVPFERGKHQPQVGLDRLGADWVVRGRNWRHPPQCH